MLISFFVERKLMEIRSEYHFSRDYPRTPTRVGRPIKKIIIVNQSPESKYKPHDLLLLT